ncbi:Gfo/Idh/MocA family protein [Adhaeribacter radiodurans]|uniref:Gfo/Idh/MocA family oxidoreductase n=1 Tax=Adhaeribacter radiodurans TaxID=2745197 RepID=A0A7L7L3U5_9BACT|nr:Gfo/Idh/MocA family oxidoreductase [Adhaeribacter radiodurans]QMU27255.1 Gfo/Idh/MocA family oxidoreductase [Adhaeribacter radiodurans]
MSEEKDLNTTFPHLSRRGFFKGSAALLGGALMSQLPFETNAYARYGADDTIKVALIGCGGRGTGAAIQALSTQGKVKLVAMADAFRDRLDESFTAISTKFPDKSRFDVSEKNKFVGFDAYKKAIPLADVVILATPPGFRPIHFEEAVNAGKHIFMEKPVATDAPGVRKVLAAAEIAKKKNLNVVVGLQRRYQNAYLETIKRINDGSIGDITSAQAYWHNAGVWVRPRKPEQTEMEYQMRNWYYFNWLCGDHILEQHIHNIDVVNWVKDGYPVSAQGMGGRQVRNGKDHGEIYDHHYVEFTYADGTIFNSQCRHQPGTMNRVEEVFVGTKGRATLSGDGKGIVTDLKGGSIYNHRSKNDPDPYQTEHDKLFAAIRSGNVINNAEYGAKSTMTAILGRNATYSGQVIKWDDALNTQLSIMPEKFAWDAPTPTKPDANGNYPIPTPGVTRVI